MPSSWLADRAAVRAYLLTKLAVLLAVALATWPLSRWLGPLAWLGLAVFAVALGLTSAAALAVAHRVGQPAGGPAAPPPADDPADDLEPVVLPVEDWIDLHSFPPAEVPDVVASYLEAAHARGLRRVCLVHGRGIGVQRERVRSLLARHPLVVAFADAPADGGGRGATAVELSAES